MRTSPTRGNRQRNAQRTPDKLFLSEIAGCATVLPTPPRYSTPPCEGTTRWNISLSYGSLSKSYMQTRGSARSFAGPPYGSRGRGDGANSSCRILCGVLLHPRSKPVCYAHRWAGVTCFPSRPLSATGGNSLAQNALWLPAPRICVGFNFCNQFIHECVMGKFPDFCNGKLPHNAEWLAGASMIHG